MSSNGFEPLLPGRVGAVGRPAGDNLRFVNGVADRGYDSNAIVQAIHGIGAEAVIPSKTNRKV